MSSAKWWQWNVCYFYVGKKTGKTDNTGKSQTGLYLSEYSNSEQAIVLQFIAESGIDYEVVAAVDINNQANNIYRQNFPETPLLQKTIEVNA